MCVCGNVNWVRRNGGRWEKIWRPGEVGGLWLKPSSNVYRWMLKGQTLLLEPVIP